jgi:hypothetical protein
MSGSGERRWRARILTAALIGIVVGAVGVWAQNGSLVGVNYDDGIYALLAKSLADGEGYRLASLPVDVPGVKYPPLYPMSLAPFWLSSGTQEAALDAMKLANGIYIGAAAGLFAFLLIDLGILVTPLAVALALLGFAAASMMLVASGLLSEPLYLVLLFLALWLSDRATERPTSGRLIVIGVLAGLVLLTRTVGAALLGAVLVATWHRYGRRRALVAGAAALLVAAPWILYALLRSSRVPELLVPGYGSYGRLYLALIAEAPVAVLDVAVSNLGAILQTLGGKLVPEAGATVESVVGAALIALAALGSRQVYRKAPATATYPWLYLVLVTLWVFPPFRFVFVLFPLLLALGAVGFLALADRAEERASAGLGRRLRIAILVVGAAALVHQAYLEFGAVRARVWDGGQLMKSAAAQEVVDWVNGNTERDDVVAFEFDPLIALHTGRQAVPNNYIPVHSWYSRSDPPVDSLARLFTGMQVSYVAVRRYIPAASEPIDRLLGAYPGSLELEYVTPGGVLIFKTDLEALARPQRGDDGVGGPQERDSGGRVVGESGR